MTTIRTLARRATRQLTSARPTTEQLLADGTIAGLQINGRGLQVAATAHLVALDRSVTGHGKTMSDALEQLADDATSALRAARRRPGALPAAPSGPPVLRVIAGGKSTSAPTEPRPVA